MDENETKINELYEKLKQIQQKLHTKIHSVYRKKDIPDRFYIKSSRRTSPIILIANANYQIFVDRDRINSYSPQTYHGNHGYNHELKSMEGLFIAFGTPFKNQYYSIRPVNLIDIYSLLCKLVKIDSRPHNGSFENIKHILNDNYLDDDYLLQDDLKDLLLYGGVLFVILIAILSIMIPVLTIMTSVKATCHNPDSNLLNQNKKKT